MKTDKDYYEIFLQTLKTIYNSKYCPRFFYVKPDGITSGVTAFFLIEWKIAFSIAILRFNTGSRENFHSHAFNAFTWWIKGFAIEQQKNGKTKLYQRSFIPKFTSINNIHKVIAYTTSYAFTIRGPWLNTWLEYNPSNNKYIILTHGRKIVSETSEG